MAMERTMRELTNLGFSEVRAREAIENIGDVTDVQLAVSWLLDHGEEDKGGAVEFKHCPHISELAPDGMLRTDQLRFGAPCLHGCKGKENWVCLICGEARCGRYVHKHSLQHWQETKRNEEASTTVEDAVSGRECLGHFLGLSYLDLSVWCYECDGYVQHERLRPLLRRMEALKFGTDESPAALPMVGTPMSAEPIAAHGLLGDPSWPMPRIARACGEEARPGYKTKQAHEFLDEPEVLRAKVKLLVELVRRSKACVAYTGAGISTASGISDYATKASDSVSGAASRKRMSPWMAEPTQAHRILVSLHAAGHLKHWVQQNHDGLPQKAGFPQKDLNEIHGAWWDPSNPVVPMDGTLRGDLIEWMLEWEDKVDLCLALGTSMVGMNADRMAVSPANRAARARRETALGTVIVALQQTQYDEISSLRIFAQIDEVMALLAEEMGITVSPSESVSGSGQFQGRLLEGLPYAADGLRRPGANLTLDLRVGSRLRVANQPDWDERRHGNVCEVMDAPEELAKEGHLQLRFPGEGGRKSVTRFMGGWWLEAAQRGEVERLPLVPCR